MIYARDASCEVVVGGDREVVSHIRAQSLQKLFVFWWGYGRDRGPCLTNLKDMPEVLPGSEEEGVGVEGFGVWKFQGREGVKEAVRYSLPCVGAVSYFRGVL